MKSVFDNLFFMNSVNFLVMCCICRERKMGDFGILEVVV